MFSLSEKTFHLSWELQSIWDLKLLLSVLQQVFCLENRAGLPFSWYLVGTVVPFVSLSYFHSMQNWNVLVKVLWWDGRNEAPCPYSYEYLEKSSLSVQSTDSSPGRMWLLPAAAVVDTFSLLLFQDHNNLECHTTQTQADLWWIPWQWLSMSSRIPHKGTQFTLLHLPTATHLLLRMSRWWNPPREDSVSLWPDSGRGRCHCKTIRMVGICPFEYLLVFYVLPLTLPCTFPH